MAVVGDHFECGACGAPLQVDSSSELSTCSFRGKVTRARQPEPQKAAVTSTPAEHTGHETTRRRRSGGDERKHDTSWSRRLGSALGSFVVLLIFLFPAGIGLYDEGALDLLLAHLPQFQLDLDPPRHSEITRRSSPAGEAP